ncbi:MAG: FkbM family methyltransferase [Chitinophagaceae bacterium]|nr:FkbM family methyltransferase [Chitinophagaceae bacterium]
MQKQHLLLPYYWLKNIRYNRLAFRIMKQILHPRSRCIDIGCHKGAFLSRILRLSPQGMHLAFEPLPHLYAYLQHRFRHQPVTVYPYALSNRCGRAEFLYVRNLPGYSGFRKRFYHLPFPRLQKIEVETITLDAILPHHVVFDFIKLDVEGAELQVLQGGEKYITTHKPFILFEHGKGAAPYYQTTPQQVFDTLSSYGLKVSRLSDWLRKQPPLSRTAFADSFHRGEYYFLAHA